MAFWIHWLEERKGWTLSAELLMLDRERAANKSLKQKELILQDASSQKGLLAAQLCSLK